MSTHSTDASSAVRRSFCGIRKIIINLWFLTLNTFYTFTREWVAKEMGAHWPDATSPAWKMVLCPEGPSHSLYNRREMQNLYIRRGSSSWRTERMYVFRVGTQPMCSIIFRWGISEASLYRKYFIVFCFEASSQNLYFLISLPRNTNNSIQFRKNCLTM